MLIEPQGNKAKDILTGKDKDWIDKTHLRSQYGLAITDRIIFTPLFVSGVVGMRLSNYWGYSLFAVSGAIQLYINVYIWFLEKEYVYPSKGPLKYYTYYWGNYIYWGTAALLYGIYRLNGHAA